MPTPAPAPDENPARPRSFRLSIVPAVICWVLGATSIVASPAGLFRRLTADRAWVTDDVSRLTIEVLIALSFLVCGVLYLLAGTYTFRGRWRAAIVFFAIAIAIMLALDWFNTSGLQYRLTH